MKHWGLTALYYTGMVGLAAVLVATTATHFIMGMVAFFIGTVALSARTALQFRENN